VDDIPASVIGTVPDKILPYNVHIISYLKYNLLLKQSLPQECHQILNIV
jgi:hypothetical protein